MKFNAQQIAEIINGEIIGNAAVEVKSLAKIEEVWVTNQEVSQTVYYEAMMQGQDGQALIKQYEEAGYLPAIKMSMLEQKVMTHIFSKELEEE